MSRSLLLLLLLLSIKLSAQTTKMVTLKATAGNISIRNVNIQTVADDRSDTTSIGTIRTGMTNKQATVNLAGGASNAISGFIYAFVNQSVATDTFSLHIMELNISEKLKGLTEQADLNTRYGFFKNGQKIIDYSGSSYVSTGADASPYIGKLVSRGIEEVLEEFDIWWAQNRQLYNESSKNQLKVTVAPDLSNKDPALISYSSSRPLTISDFKGTADPMSKAMAATNSGFRIQYELKGDHTGSQARINIMPYFDRSGSWMKNSGKTDYVLQHEQLHFDITAIKTYELIAAIKSTTFSLGGFKEEMDALQTRYMKEMDQMQAEYDAETSHGIFRDKQKSWLERVRNELKEKAAAAGL